MSRNTSLLTSQDWIYDRDTSQDWVCDRDSGVPCGPIYTIDQTFADPQVRHLRMVRPIAHPRLGELDLLTSALNVDGASKDIRTPTREPGADTVAVLRQFGYQDAEIDELQAKRAI